MSDGPPLLVAGPRRVALARLGTGVLLILLAVVIFAGSRLVAGSQRHSYDPGARSPGIFGLTEGRTYQLSAPVGVATLQKNGVLTSLDCSWSTNIDVFYPLPLTAMTDDRDLRTFATFTAPAGGQLYVNCSRIDNVFVDDAEDSGGDTSAILLLLAIAVGVLGVAAAVSGAYELDESADRL